MISEKIVHPYNLALELDRLFTNTSDGKFEDKEFYNIVDTFVATGSFEEQVKAFDLFKTLSKNDIIKRTTKVAKLTSLLERISSNKKEK
jgi:hypothetical protein